jgi:mannose PTS system EIIA component
VAAVDEGEGVVVVTDMFGGTPSNLAMQACREGKRVVLYGANLPLLIKLAKARRLSIDEAVSCALTAGRKYINTADGYGPEQRDAGRDLTAAAGPWAWRRAGGCGCD